jgi:hypothetical protein
MYDPKTMDFRVARFFVEHHVNNCTPPLEGISMRKGVVGQCEVSGSYRGLFPVKFIFFQGIGETAILVTGNHGMVMTKMHAGRGRGCALFPMLDFVNIFRVTVCCCERGADGIF